MPLIDTQVWAWAYAFARIAGWTLFDPLVGRLPVALRLMLAAGLAAALAPALPAVALDPLSLGGLLALLLEAAWGAALALAVWLLFATVEAAWVWTGHTATGGLLNLTAEQAQSADRAWRTLAAWLAAMAFLAASGHLLVIHALRESFTAMPVVALPALGELRPFTEAGGRLFVAGMQLALPLLALALLVQLAWAIVARTTAGWDMFSIGLGVGSLALLVVWIAAVPLVATAVGRGVSALGSWTAGLITR